MSLAKSVPEGLKPRECERTKLHEPPPIPYIPKKDEVQDKVARLRNLQIKTSLEKDTTLNFLVWHKNGTREAFLMHVTAVLDAMKKRGHFKDFKKAQKAYVEAEKAVRLAEAGLALLNKTSAGTSLKHKKKALAKAMEATKKALAKVPSPKSEAKEAEEAPKVNDNTMRAGFQVDLAKTKQAQKIAKGAMTAAASKMFVFYSNLLSPESKYTWNKIVSEQIEGNPFVNLQGISLEGPRGMSRELFDDCVMFHLLTVFPINAAEQEKYYVTNVLKKPQRINMRQFVCLVEQLNTYIAHMLCFYYSPRANASTKPKNVPFTEAELGAHVLRMCPLQWQDQYNMNKKGMMPMDMCLLLTLLEAIKCVCTYEKGKLEFSKKSSHKSKKGKKRPGTNSIIRVPKKVYFKKHCNLCKKHGSAYTTHNTHDCCRFEKEGKEKFDFCTTKKGRKKDNPVNHSFTQLTKKIKKLEEALKKSGKKGKKRSYKDSNSNSEYGVGLGSTRKIAKIRETVVQTKFTPPSPIKATPTTIASNSNDASTMSVSEAGDVMMTSSSQKEGIRKKNSILPKKDPPEGKITAIVAVMRGRPKPNHHRQCSNKHYKQILVRVLLDSGSDGNLVFVDKDKPMLLPSSKRLVPQSWNTSNGMFQTKRKAKIELNFFEYSDNKKYLAEPDIIEYDKNNKPQYDLILSVETKKKYGIN
jgi:hypothetical protein